MASRSETGETSPYADLVNPINLPQAEKDAYYQRYFDALEDGSATPFYEGMKALERLITESGFGIGAMIRVYDDMAYEIDPHFVLTREGWKVVNKDEAATPDLSELLRRPYVKWSLAQHAVILDSDPQALP